MDFFLNEKTCPVCYSDFEPKRRNQVYCCREHQVLANNSRAKSVRDSFKVINTKLRRSWQTLKELYKNDPEHTFSRYEFGIKGVDLTYHTHDVLDDDGEQHIAIYDFVIFKIESDQYKVIKR